MDFGYELLDEPPKAGDRPYDPLAFNPLAERLARGPQTIFDQLPFLDRREPPTLLQTLLYTGGKRWNDHE